MLSYPYGCYDGDEYGKVSRIEIMNCPGNPAYAKFTIRVSGYALKSINLTREQQQDVIAHTCHETLG